MMICSRVARSGSRAVGIVEPMIDCVTIGNVRRRKKLEGCVD